MKSPNDVVDLCSDLIKIDTSASGQGERRAAELVAARLSDMGFEPLLLEKERNRSNVVTRVPGTDPTRSALLVQMHLDVVPADPDGWTVPPFAGEVHEEMLWGRGAVDMKDMLAMSLTALETNLATGWRPDRDIVVALLADEEMGGRLGAGWLVDERPDLFEGCRESIGEAGGFSHQLSPEQRVYFIQVAEKGICWLRLLARGEGGHGSLIHTRNPIGALSEAVARIETFASQIRTTASTVALIDSARTWSGEKDPQLAIASLGPVSRLFLPTLRNTYNVTQLSAGVQHNVVPATATATVDGRYVPGYEAEFLAEIQELLGDLEAVEIEVVFTNRAVETTFEGAVPDAITSALQQVDPGSRAVPVCLPIGTDGKHFDRLSIRGYGFSPLLLPPDYDFASMFHGIDERVPVSSLRTGVEVLRRFFELC